MNDRSLSSRINTRCHRCYVVDRHCSLCGTHRNTVGRDACFFVKVPTMTFQPGRQEVCRFIGIFFTIGRLHKIIPKVGNRPPGDGIQGRHSLAERVCCRSVNSFCSLSCVLANAHERRAQARRSDRMSFVTPAQAGVQ
jgi:hypothetical protein